jgi:hypothetical protein
MIHHLARAFFVRHTALLGSGKPPADGDRPANSPAPRPVKARPITPWHTPARPDNANSNAATPPRSAPAPLAGSRRVRISTDPSDARRTVIAGRFAEVCAALDRLVMEHEAAL